MVVTCIWAAIFVLKMLQERNIEIIHDQKSPTPQDFTLIFRGLPKDYTKEMLQLKLDEYASLVSKYLIYPDPKHYSTAPYDTRFTIKTFNPIRAYY